MKRLNPKTEGFTAKRSIFFKDDGTYEILSEPPEEFSFGAEIGGDDIYTLKANRGAFVLNFETTKWKTSTGSAFDYTNRYDGNMPITDWDTVNLYILSTPKTISGYYSGIVETSKRFVTYNDIPHDLEKASFSETWGKGSWEDVSDNYTQDVYNSFTNDGKTLWGYWWNWNVAESEGDYIYEINIEDGTYNYYQLEEKFEWLVQKPNGDLLLVDKNGNKAWIFKKTGEGTHSLTPLADPNSVDALCRVSLNFVPENHFYISPDGKRYYTYTVSFSWKSDLTCYDMETDEFLWNTESKIDDFYILERALQNPVDGNFIIPSTDYTTAVFNKIDGVTGEIIQTGGSFADSWNYYSEVGFSYDGSKFYISNYYSTTILVEYGTLNIIDESLTGVGIWYNSSVTTADGYAIIPSDTDTVNEGVTGGLDIFDYNTNSVTQWRPSWEKQFPYFMEYQYITPTDIGLVTKTEAGQVILLTNETLNARTIGTYNPSTDVGQPLPEGWYYDTIENPVWNPVTFLNYRGPHIRNYKMNLDFGTGEKLYMIVEEEGEFIFYTFETGFWVEAFRQTMPLNFQFINYSRNGSGWIYDGSSTRAYNFLTQETKNIVSIPPSHLTTNIVPSFYENVEYFFTSESSLVNNHSYKYNHTTNTWTQIARRPGNLFRDVSSPILYAGDLWSVGADLQTPRTTNIARYDIAADSWTVVTTSPEGPVSEPTPQYSDTQYDISVLVDNEIYLPNTGYKYNIDTDTWSDITRLTPTAKNVVTFKDGKIVYIYPRSVLWFETATQHYSDYNISAYALPGAVIPY